MSTIARPRVRPFPATAYLGPSEVRAVARRWLALRKEMWRARQLARSDRIGLEGIRRPVWALRSAIGEYRACGSQLVTAGISPLRQVSRTWWSDVRYHAPAEVARHYSMSPSTSWRTARLCLIAGANMPQLYRLAVAVSDPSAAATLADKRRFADWCESRALPVVVTVAELEGGSLVRSRCGDDVLPRASLFSKRCVGFGGDDTATWRYDGGRYQGSDGRLLTSTELVSALEEQSRARAVLVQPLLSNHATIARLAPSALSTIRVMTIAARGEAPTFLAGVLRMGTGRATADNFALGGIAAPIDAETGELGDARGLDANGLPHLHRVHPDTGVAIAGTHVPFWRESIELALHAHAVLGDLPVVGWDVAVTPDGPVLVEGNWNPCIKLLQVATQTPVLATTLAAVLLDRIGERGTRA
jgi:hypothetical protein